MGGYSGWFDPICYQFYFYHVNSTGFSPEVSGAYGSFLEEIKPYFEHCISLNESLLLKIHDNQAGFIVRKISGLKEVNDSFNAISNGMDPSTDEVKWSLCSGKIPRQFAAPGKEIPLDWKKDVMRYMNDRNESGISEKEQREWLYRILNCSSDDLKTCCFPSKCFASGSETFVLHHRCIPLNGTAAYANEILKEIGMEQKQNLFVEYIYVSIPRYLLRHMNRSFDLQDRWKKRLKQLSAAFRISVGGIKVDCFKSCRTAPLLTIHGNYKLGFSERIPDVSWGMCMTEEQMKGFNQSDAVFECLHQVERLENGNVYLQLTPNMDTVPIENIQKLWKWASNKIEPIECMDYSVYEVPNSMQMGIGLENLHMDEPGYYCFRI